MAETRAPIDSQGPLVQIKGLRKHFPVTKGAVLQRTVGHVKAVDGVSFSISKGEALGLVGESGCGKTTIACCLLKLVEPTGGEILFDGQDIERLDKQSTGLPRRARGGASNAPAPVPTLGGRGATVSRSPSKMSYEEYAAGRRSLSRLDLLVLEDPAGLDTDRFGQIAAFTTV